MWKVKRTLNPTGSVAAPAEFPMEMRYRSILEGLAPPDPLAQFHLRRGSPEEEFPDLSRNYTWMGRILTPAMYRRQFNRCTSSGVVFDDVIRPGLEEPGQRSGPVSVGCAAGDAQSYILFCDFFDRVIEAHHEHKISSETPESDLNYANLKGSDDLDGSYAVGCELSVVRGVEDFCFPPHCSRGERRQLLALARRGTAVPDRFRLSHDGSLVIWVNMDEHLRLVSTRGDANVAEALRCICTNLQKLETCFQELRHPFIWKQQLGWLTSSPADVGTGLRVSVRLKLQLLPRHRRLQDILKRLRIRMGRTGIPAMYCVTNAATFGLSEVALTQLVVDGVKLLVAMETRLEENLDIEGLIPAQK
ncbi:zgc:172076 isoform X6 [Betta splendens]|uniref:creatine kinase n=1 Tax=Betta splendens TaxID=158456 RepID=A0A6P7N4A4_BETSP|nr:zgc:172076 isoform X6 [Betta splendens]